MVFASSFRRKSLASILAGESSPTRPIGRVPSRTGEEQEDDTAGYCPPSNFFLRASVSGGGRRPSFTEALSTSASSSSLRHNHSSTTVSGAPLSPKPSPRRPSLFQSWKSGRRRSSVQASAVPHSPSSPSSFRPNKAALPPSPIVLDSEQSKRGKRRRTPRPSSATSSSSSSSWSLYDNAVASSSKTSGIAGTWIYGTHQWSMDGSKGSQRPTQQEAIGLDVELQRHSPSPSETRRDRRSIVSMSLTEEIALYQPKDQETTQGPSWQIPDWNAPSLHYPDEQQSEASRTLDMSQSNESGFIDPHFSISPSADQDVGQWSDFAPDSFPTPRPERHFDLPSDSGASRSLHRRMTPQPLHIERLPLRHHDQAENDAWLDDLLTPRLVRGQGRRSRSSMSGSSSMYSPTLALPPTPGVQQQFPQSEEYDDAVRRDSADSLNKQFCSVLLLDLGNGTTVSMSPSPSAQHMSDPLHHYSFPTVST